MKLIAILLAVFLVAGCQVTKQDEPPPPAPIHKEEAVQWVPPRSTPWPYDDSTDVALDLYRPSPDRTLGPSESTYRKDSQRWRDLYIENGYTPMEADHKTRLIMSDREDAIFAMRQKIFRSFRERGIAREEACHRTDRMMSIR